LTLRWTDQEGRRFRQSFEGKVVAPPEEVRIPVRVTNGPNARVNGVAIETPHRHAWPRDADPAHAIFLHHSKRDLPYADVRVYDATAQIVRSHRIEPAPHDAQFQDGNLHIRSNTREWFLVELDGSLVPSARPAPLAPPRRVRPKPVRIPWNEGHLVQTADGLAYVRDGVWTAPLWTHHNTLGLVDGKPVLRRTGNGELLERTITCGSQAMGAPSRRPTPSIDP
jgi:hypothetical protein